MKPGWARFLTAVALILLFGMNSIYAQEKRVTLVFRGSLGWQGQGVKPTAQNDNYPNGVSANQIINYAGFATHLSFGKFLGIAPGIDLFFDDYIYLDSYGQAFPTQKQTGSSLGQLATTMVLNLNLPWLMAVPISDVVLFKLALGPGLLLRIPAIPLDGTEKTDKLAGYLLGEARWLNLYVEPFFFFYLTERFAFSLSMKILLPVWHAWDSTKLPFYDTMFVAAVLGLNIDL